MTIYDLLRDLIKAAAKTGGMSKQDAFHGVNLVNKLEETRAFGTLVNLERGEFSNERH